MAEDDAATDHRSRQQESARLWRWQTRMLPFVGAAIGLLALFFFVSSFIQLQNLNEAVRLDSGAAVKAALAQIDRRAGDLDTKDATDLLKWKTMVVLEADTIQRRYQQVNATLRMRAWTRHTGFVTGMIMAFVGAIFILSKLSEARTELGGEAQGIKASLATSSPGIVLAVLGTVLMLVTLTANYSFTTVDAPVYLDGARGGTSARPDMPPPNPGPADGVADDLDAKDIQLFNSSRENNGAEPPRPSSTRPQD